MAQPEIFISYRRSGATGDADHLYSYLLERFGRDRLFLDRVRLQSGAAWRPLAADAIRTAKVLIVLVDESWNHDLETAELRLNQEDDDVRYELQTGLECGVPLWPVLIDSAEIPAARDLPPQLRGLRSVTAFRVRRNTWHADAEYLREAIEQILAGTYIAVQHHPADLGWVTVTFDTDILPDPVKVYDASKAVEEGRRVDIHWPDPTQALYKRQRGRRSTLEHELSDAGLHDDRRRIADGLDEFDRQLSYAGHIYEYADQRIQRMWDGMVRYGDLRRNCFQYALMNFLLLSNLKLLRCLASVTLHGDNVAIPPECGDLGSRGEHNFYQTPSLRRLLGSDEPFWAMDVSGNTFSSMYVYLSKSSAQSAYHQDKSIGLTLYSYLHELVIPQIELRMIASDSNVVYDGSIRITKIRDEHFKETR